MRRRELTVVLAGAAAAWPLALRAQLPGKTYRLAILHSALPVEALTAEANPAGYGVFFGELSRLGYVEGQEEA